MLGAIGFFGVLLILGVLAAFVLGNRFTQFPFLNNRRILLVLLGVGVFLSLSNWLFFYSRFGHQYYLVYPTGGWSTVSGLSPQERAQLQKDIAIGVADRLSAMQLPLVYIDGGQNGGKGNMGLIESLLGAEIAKSMIPAIKEK